MEQKLKDCWKAEQLCIYTALNCNCFQIILAKQSVVFSHTQKP